MKTFNGLTHYVKGNISVTTERVKRVKRINELI